MTPFTDELARQHSAQLLAEAAQHRLVRELRAGRRSRRSQTSSWRPLAAMALHRAAVRLDPGRATGPAHATATPAMVLVPLLDVTALDLHRDVRPGVATQEAATSGTVACHSG